MNKVLAVLLMLLAGQAHASRSFGHNANDALSTANAAVTTVPLSICAEIKLVGTTGGDQFIAGVLTSGSINNYWALELDGGGHPVATTRTTGNATAQAAVTISDTTTWHHLCFVSSANNSRSIYVDGANKVTETTSRTPSGVNLTQAGLAGDSTLDANLKIAHLSVWSVALSDGEVATLAAGALPFTVEPANLVDYYPLGSNASPETDYGSLNHSLTVTGASYDSDTPTVGYLDEQFVKLTSVSGTSPCNSITSPTVAAGDYLIIDPVMSPLSVPPLKINIGADCDLNYTGAASRQSAAWAIYDASATALMAGSPGNLVFNDQAPFADSPVSIGPLPTGTSMGTIAFDQEFTDAENDPITCTSSDTGTGTGADTRPAGTTITGCSWSGTPTANGTSGSFTITAADPAGATGTLVVNWNVASQVATPTCSSDITTCIGLYNTAGVNFTLTSQCSASVASGNVISQNPTAGTMVNVNSTGALVVSQGLCSTIRTLDTAFIPDNTAVPDTAVFNAGVAYTQDGHEYVSVWPTSNKVVYQRGLAYRQDGALTICVSSCTTASYIRGIAATSRGEVIAQNCQGLYTVAGIPMLATGVVCMSSVN